MQLALESVLPKLGVLVNASRVGEYVAKLFGDEVREGPALDMRVSIVPRTSGTAVSADDSREEPSPPRVRRLARPSSTRRRSRPRSPRLRRRRAPSGSWPWWPCSAPSSASPASAPRWRGSSSCRAARAAAGDRARGRAAGARRRRSRAAAEHAGGGGSRRGVHRQRPPGAAIVFGNRGNAGTTPLEIGMVQPGTYDVRLTLEGHADWTGQVQVAAGQRAALHAQLVAEERPRDRPAAGPPGELSLNTQPWSRVYLGSRLLGTTPLGRVPVPSGTGAAAPRGSRRRRAPAHGAGATRRARDRVLRPARVTRAG
ncbi:MAG: PEGA domain-containing protein [Sandaracinaceae bacterium]|nr:PEGA domain-containing protein [Sandaracinaceae bacterium]